MLFALFVIFYDSNRLPRLARPVRSSYGIIDRSVVVADWNWRTQGLYSKHDVLEHLRTYHIDARDIALWEEQFKFTVPVNSAGEPEYSMRHINMFKNIKKNLMLGHSVQTIQSMISGPQSLDDSDSVPVMQSVLAQTSVKEPAQGDIWDDWEPESGIPFSQDEPMISSGFDENPTSVTAEPVPAADDAPLFQKALVSLSKDAGYASAPSKTVPQKDGVNSITAMAPNHSMQVMMDRLMEEKRDLHQRLIETEKLNSHLYNANNMFHRKVKALNDAIEKLREENGEHRYFKALDEKARLHKQLIAADKTIQDLKKAVAGLKHDKLSLQRTYQADMEGFSRQLQYLQSESMDAKTLMPTLFCGQWNETIILNEKFYDHYGVDIPNMRERTFRISEPPKVISGVVGTLSITYAYEQNTRWKRHETHYITPVGAERLKGFVVVEYWLENTPVAKASYRVACVRHRGTRQDETGHIKTAANQLGQ